MCATNALAIYLCFAFPVAATAPQGLPETYDHYQPANLNQTAVERLRAGDESTAQILLERAALLAPYDMTISGNLVELKAYRVAASPLVLRGEETAPGAAPAAAPPAGDASQPPLPALWPKK